MIHPTAVVSEGAHLGENIRIGPYAVVESGACIGDGCSIEAHAVVTGHVRMGTSNIVSQGAVIGADPQDLRFDPKTVSYVQIGDRNRFREHCTIHRATLPGAATVVGDDCFLMVGVHLGHDSKVGNRVVMANGVMLGGFVEVQDSVFLGGGTGVHQFVRIGRLAIAQGNSSLSKNVPPYTMAALLNQVVGLNTVGLRRSGLTLPQRNEVKKAFNLLYRSGLNASQALAASRLTEWSPEGTSFWEFVEVSKKRGICRWAGRKGAADGAEEPEREGR